MDFLSFEQFAQAGRMSSIPRTRITEKLDQYVDEHDYAAAERHLLYWLEEARSIQDLRGALFVYNEMIGLYRKAGLFEKAESCVSPVLHLLQTLSFEDTITAGTTYVNIATAFQAAGRHAEAMQYFEKASGLYAAHHADASLLGGLYNNMGLTLSSLGQYRRALECYGIALKKMKEVRNGELEQAITCLNMANTVEEEMGLEAGESRIYQLVDQACTLLDTPTLPRDGYYGFVLEKCIPTLEYYGCLAAENYRRILEDIHARA